MRNLSMTEALYEYMLDVSIKEHPVQTTCRMDTARLPLALMQVSPVLAQFIQFLLRSVNAKKVLELGTYTGYSALAMALALPEDGIVITCDINQDNTEKAKAYWRAAGVEDKIQLRLAKALHTLQTLIDEGAASSFDFIFIDADKTNYVAYYEYALALIKPEGIIAIDNIFWDGRVIESEASNGQVREIRRLNELIKEDKRVITSLLPIDDGLFLVQKARS